MVFYYVFLSQLDVYLCRLRASWENVAMGTLVLGFLASLITSCQLSGVWAELRSVHRFNRKCRSLSFRPVRGRATENVLIVMKRRDGKANAD